MRAILRRLVMPALFGAIPAAAAAQSDVILAKDARKYTNQRVTVEGKVAQVRRQGSETWVALERSYPGSPLVIVLSEAVATAMGDVQGLKGKLVRVSGTVQPSALEGPPPMMGREATPEVGGGRPRAPSILLEDVGKLVVVGEPPK